VFQKWNRQTEKCFPFEQDSHSEYNHIACDFWFESAVQKRFRPDPVQRQNRKVGSHGEFSEPHPGDGLPVFGPQFINTIMFHDTLTFFPEYFIRQSPIFSMHFSTIPNRFNKGKTLRNPRHNPDVAKAEDAAD
jgi:hypothetical protein